MYHPMNGGATKRGNDVKNEEFFGKEGPSKPQCSAIAPVMASETRPFQADEADKLQLGKDGGTTVCGNGAAPEGTTVTEAASSTLADQNGKVLQPKYPNQLSDANYTLSPAISRQHTPLQDGDNQKESALNTSNKPHQHIQLLKQVLCKASTWILIAVMLGLTIMWFLVSRRLQMTKDDLEYFSCDDPEPSRTCRRYEKDRQRRELMKLVAVLLFVLILISFLVRGAIRSFVVFTTSNNNAVTGTANEVVNDINVDNAETETAARQSLTRIQKSFLVFLLLLLAVSIILWVTGERKLKMYEEKVQLFSCDNSARNNYGDCPRYERTIDQAQAQVTSAIVLFVLVLLPTTFLLVGPVRSMVGAALSFVVATTEASRSSSVDGACFLQCNLSVTRQHLFSFWDDSVKVVMIALGASICCSLTLAIAVLTFLVIVMIPGDGWEQCLNASTGSERDQCIQDNRNDALVTLALLAMGVFGSFSLCACVSFTDRWCVRHCEQEEERTHPYNNTADAALSYSDEA